MTQDGKNRVCLGAFAGAHGVNGATQIKTFTQNSKNISAYGPVETEDGSRKFTLKFIRDLKPTFILAQAPEITSREDAQALKGQRIYVDKAMLPPPEPDAFYHNDLIGLEARDEQDAPLGWVKAIYNFGAGDLLELENIPEINGVRLVPFTKDAVPVISIAEKRITILRAAVEIDVDNPTASDETKGEKPDID